MSINETTPEKDNGVQSKTTDRVAFEDRLAFQFDAEGLLTVTIASVQHILMPEEAAQLRNWLLSGEEFTQDD